MPLRWTLVIAEMGWAVTSAAAKILSLREFLGAGLTGSVPDYSTVSRTRWLIDLETHSEVFSWMLAVLGRADLIDGKKVGVDAAMRSIVRRDNGESYNDFLRRLAKESGIETPTRRDLAKRDRKRPKKGSNKDWEHPDDPDARITKMKDGRTHLANKVEHAVDMTTGAVLAVTVQRADAGATTTIQATTPRRPVNSNDWLRIPDCSFAATTSRNW